MRPIALIAFLSQAAFAQAQFINWHTSYREALQ